MIRALQALTRWLTRPNPARELALIGHAKHRELVKARTRQIRDELGLPERMILR